MSAPTPLIISLFLLLTIGLFPEGLAAQSTRRAGETPEAYAERLARERAVAYEQLNEQFREIRRERREMRRKRRYQGLEIFGGVNTLPGGAYWWYPGTATYDRLDEFENGAATFVFNEGEQVYGRCESSCYSYDDRYDDQTFSSMMYRLGGAYQTSWGGRFMLSGLYARYRQGVEDGAFGQVPEGSLRTFSTQQEDIVATELGFQYTFFRSRRIRPYLGVNMINFLYYYGDDTVTVVDGTTGQTGLVRRFFSKEYSPMYTEFSLELGIQVQVTPRTSVGALVWANNGANIYIEAPFGLEVRHRLGKNIPVRVKKKDRP